MAKEFRFRLEVVRRLREQARDAQRRAVADAVRAVARAEQDIDRLTGQLRQTVELNRGQRTLPRVDIPALRVGEFYRNWLHHRILDRSLSLARDQAHLQAERSRLGQASARLKAIEKLRERRWSRYRQQLVREEQAQSDEAALRRFAARSQEAAS